ncbi:Gfo/Idh/MocA family protein [Mangrovicella endophytica]|uniref:Gfo/Idh/MocA family protein n=1 Tax=Mangrovicella endophytica TaxID=2066697 RepID=UPI000C9EBDA3|nr:Gfo/Idh/MocA family oxidoreductase [Mangrovicella endophytica]
MTLRIAVCGTGHWARTIHLPGLKTLPGVELVGVHGRTPATVEALASEFTIAAFTDFEALLPAVDALAFAVPPDVQVGLAIRAAEAGKHLLLEKPLATKLADADRLTKLTQARDLATVSFFTRRFIPAVEAFIAEAVAARPQRCDVTFRGSALLPGSPYAASAWRLAEHGVLRDLGPHALSVLVPVLGPVASVAAADEGGEIIVDLVHAGGGTARLRLNLSVPREAGEERYDFGPDGPVLERYSYDRLATYRSAAAELVHLIETGSRDHRCDIRFARDVVAILAAAEASLAQGGARVSTLPLMPQ